MTTKRIHFSIIILFFSFSAFSQVDSTMKDSIEEIVIYEYDTLYYAPDTIFTSDTIYRVDTIFINKNKKKRNRKWIQTFKSIRKNYQFSIIPRSYSLVGGIFFNGKLEETLQSDSLYFQPNYNYSYSLQLSYNLLAFELLFGIGNSKLNEQFYYYNSYQTQISTSTISNNYDSLTVDEKIVVNTYYDNLNLYVLLGKRFDLNRRKLFFSFHGGCFADYLLKYEQGNTNISKDQVKNISLSFLFTPKLSIRLKRNFELYFAPYLKWPLNKSDKFPKNTLNEYGINLGVTFTPKEKTI
jgi:hypothetical protein